MYGKRKWGSFHHTSLPKRLKYTTQNPVGLLDLPIGPLHMIISKVDLGKQMMLRQTSWRMKIEHSSYIMHQYKFTVNLVMRSNAGTAFQKVLSNVMRVLDASTYYFVNSGYESEFTAIMMLFPNQLVTAREDFCVEHMQEFLLKFYNRVETAVTGLKKTIERRVLLTMTLLNLVRQFRGFRIQNPGTEILFWQLIFELRGIRFGVTERVPNESDLNKMVDLIIIIAELLVYDLARQNKTDFIEIGNNSYVYSIKEPTKSMRCPKIKFKVRVVDSPLVFKIFQSVIDGTLDIKNFNFDLPNINDLSILVETKSGHFHLWGGYDRVHLLIVPF